MPYSQFIAAARRGEARIEFYNVEIFNMPARGGIGWQESFIG
jgi:hypothetical protein